MGFDIEAAKKAGYTKEEIDSFIANQPKPFDVTPDKFDVEGALKAGWKEKDIADFLVSKGIGQISSNTTDPVTMSQRVGEYGGIQEKEPPGFWKQEGPAMAGATGGGMAGAKLGSIFGPWGTAMGGALGAAGGGFLGQLGSQKLLDQPLDVKAASQTGALMGAGQAVGDIGFFALKKAWPYIGKEYLQVDTKKLGEIFAPYVDKYLPVKQKVSQGFFPYQMAEPESAAAKYQNILESSFGGRKPTSRFHFAQRMGAKEVVKETSDIMWDGITRLPPEQVGKKTLNAYELATDASRAIADKMYKDVDDLTSKIIIPKQKVVTTQIVDPTTQQPMTYQKTVLSHDIVDYTNVIDYMKKVLIGKKSGRSEMGDVALQNAIDDMKQGAGTFLDAQDNRVRLGKVIGHFDDRDPGKGLMIKAKELLDQAMDTAADKSGNPQIKTLYARAKDYWKGHIDTYHNMYMDEFAKKAAKNPSIAVDMFIKADQPELINTLWKATGGKNTVAAQNVQAMAVEKWLTQVMKEEGSSILGAEGGTEVGNRLWNILKTMDGKNGNLKQIFPEPIADRLWMTAKILSTVQKSPKSGGGGMLIQILQASAPYSLAAGLGIGGYNKAKGEDFIQPEAVAPMAMGAAVLFTPRVIAKLITHPVYGKWFIEGLDPKSTLIKSTYHTGQTINKLIAAAADYYMLDQGEQTQQKSLTQLPGQTIEKPKWNILGLGR